MGKAILCHCDPSSNTTHLQQLECLHLVDEVQLLACTLRGRHAAAPRHSTPCTQQLKTRLTVHTHTAGGEGVKVDSRKHSTYSYKHQTRNRLVKHQTDINYLSVWCYDNNRHNMSRTHCGQGMGQTHAAFAGSARVFRSRHAREGAMAEGCVYVHALMLDVCNVAGMW